MPNICAFRECCESAKLVCARCNSEFYCSKPCQIRAFSEHRFNCFELPSLRSIDESVDVVSKKINQFDIVSHVETDVKKQVEKVPETAAPKLATPENEVKPAPVQQKQVEKPAPIQQKQVEKIEQTTPAVQQIPSSRASVVSNIRFPLMKANIPTQAIKSPAEPQRILYSDLKIRNLPTTPFKAIFLEGDPDKKLFSACQLENSDYLNDIGICIVEYLKHSESKTSYKPKKDEVVLASFEGSFFRAVCKEKVTDGYNVFYLDYGNSDMVKEADMRPIDKSLAFDVVTHSVYIENFPIEMDERQAEILQGNGIPIEDARKLKDGYVARITGL